MDMKVSSNAQIFSLIVLGRTPFGPTYPWGSA